MNEFADRSQAMGSRTDERSRGDDPDAPMVEIEDVSVTLGTVQALDGVSLTVDPGRFVGVIGPNGAGKTTLLRTITAAIRPEAGTVRVAGWDIHSLASKAASRWVAAVPQDTALAFDFSVKDLVAMGRTPYISRFRTGDRIDHDAVDRAMERTEVRRFADRAISDVSGGERQRVLLARALAQDTPVLLLDEPTASLDINHQVRTLEIVRELVDAGKTVIAAIHDLNLAARYCDELVLLDVGRTVERGPPARVLTNRVLEGPFDTATAVTGHPVSGSTHVTALPEVVGEHDGLVHVIGGGGTATRHLYNLWRAGYTISVGAVPEGDTDLETARALGIDAIVVPPYADIDEAASTRVAAAVNRADVTVVADIPITPGNIPNLTAALQSEVLLITEGRDLGRRNVAGDEGAELCERLSSHGTAIAPDDVAEAVDEAICERDDDRSPPP